MKHIFETNNLKHKIKIYLCEREPTATFKPRFNILPYMNKIFKKFSSQEVSSKHSTKFEQKYV